MLPATRGIFAGTMVFGSTPTTSAGIPVMGETIDVILDLTAVTGTNPSLLFEIQWSMDGATWASSEPADIFDPLTTAPKTVAKQFEAKGPYFRACATVTGTNTGTDTPTFTGTANAYI